MGGIVEEFNPLEGLKKLGMNHDFNFIVDGKNEDSKLSLDVIGFPTKGVFHLKFTKVSGMDSSELKWWLDYECLIFNLDKIELNMEQGTVNIELCPEGSDMCFYLENIKSVWRQNKEEIEVSREDIMNNKYYKQAMNPRKTSIFSVIKGIFK